MTLKSYDFFNPKTGEMREVFEFPSCYLPSGFKKFYRTVIVSEKPLCYPLIEIHNVYLTEHKNCRITVDEVWLDNTYVNPPEEIEETEKNKSKK